MRVAIVNLTGGGLSGGYVKYLDSLLPLLAAHPDMDRLDVLSPEAIRARLSNAAGTQHFWSAADVTGNYSGVRAAIRRIQVDALRAGGHGAQRGEEAGDDGSAHSSWVSRGLRGRQKPPRVERVASA